MIPIPHLLLLFAASPLPLLPQPDPNPPRPSTVPASREQPGSAPESCPLDLRGELFRSVFATCAGDAGGGFCCPAIAAWLYTAYSAAALETHVLPSGARPYDELPALPGDSEGCAAAAGAALRERGVVVPGANDTCDAAACACGVLLRPMQCPGPFVVAAGAGGDGRWVPADDVAERLEDGCGRPGAAGCGRCLGVLHQLKSEKKEKYGINVKGSDDIGGRECQIMGLTWLLSRNRTLYLPTVASVFRALRGAAAGEYPATCSSSADGNMPLPVGSDQLLSPTSSAAGRWLLPAITSPAAHICPLVLLFFFLYENFQIFSAE